MHVQFFGATQTVTGSRFLVTGGDRRILVDCGLFQGFKDLRLKNRAEFPFDPKALDAVVLTHAHLDHSGALPLLVKRGFKGPVYATPATVDLCGLLLTDAGYLQEEEAKYANQKGFSKHSPALPLFTREDAERSLESFVPVDFHRRFAIGPGMDFEFHRAGHLLGAASVKIQADGRALGFSGDLGRNDDPLMRSPVFSESVDTLVMESTYGNRRHVQEDPALILGDVIRRTVARHGVIVIPSFAIGRAQLVLFHLMKLKDAGLIPDIPVFLNSPMADRANDIFLRHLAELRIDAATVGRLFDGIRCVRSIEESIALNRQVGKPMILVAASGMATGGRVLHHLKAFAPDPRNAIIFVGFQSGGTRGEAIVHGADRIKIHGEYWPIHAEVVSIESMSAHADADGLVAWTGGLGRPPRKVFLVHGEPSASEALRLRLAEEMSLNVKVAEFSESAEV